MDCLDDKILLILVKCKLYPIYIHALYFPT